jgi:hypothetical protein
MLEQRQLHYLPSLLEAAVDSRAVESSFHHRHNHPAQHLAILVSELGELLPGLV